MAQLFTVYFPNYCFEIQEEFSITFPDASKLPFTVDVSDKGVPHVHSLKEIDFKTTGLDDRKLFLSWIEDGLKSGLRISAIDGREITKVVRRGAGLGHTVYVDSENDNSPMTAEKLMMLIIKKGQRDITFSFIEHIPNIDEGEPLGLQWTESMKSYSLSGTESKDEEKQSAADTLDVPSPRKMASKSQPLPPNRTNDSKRNPLMSSTPKSNTLKTVHFQQRMNSKHTMRSLPRMTIPDEAISVSSFHEDHPPYTARLNHPDSYWRPSLEQELGRNVWIAIDLGRRQFVDKIQIQVTF